MESRRQSIGALTVAVSLIEKFKNVFSIIDVASLVK